MPATMLLGGMSGNPVAETKSGFSLSFSELFKFRFHRFHPMKLNIYKQSTRTYGVYIYILQEFRVSVPSLLVSMVKYLPC